MLVKVKLFLWLWSLIPETRLNFNPHVYTLPLPRHIICTFIRTGSLFLIHFYYLRLLSYFLHLQKLRIVRHSLNSLILCFIGVTHCKGFLFHTAFSRALKSLSLLNHIHFINKLVFNLKLHSLGNTLIFPFWVKYIFCNFCLIQSLNVQ